MHLQPNTKALDLRLVTLLALICPVAQAQYQVRYRPAPVPDQRCQVVDGRFVCGRGAITGAAMPASFNEPFTTERAPEQRSRSSELPVLAVAQRVPREPVANPEAPDQSELLRRSKDPDFILRNFKTMYIETRDITLFKPSLVTAELEKNPEFRKLNIHIVQDPRVADTVLTVSYNFAWDYPFELRHQNTTTILLAGKGEGPFSGPLGAWDVARQFTNAAKKWRTAPDQQASTEKPRPEQNK
jgi:hypothetical protein